MREKNIKVIVVEDNAADREIIGQFFQAERPIEFHFIEDGEEAYEYLTYETGDIILLDINLPKVSGFEILKQIKTGIQSSNIVVILTSSPNPEEVQKAYDLNANGYVVKPIDFNAFKEKLKAMGSFLVDTIEKPK